MVERLKETIERRARLTASEWQAVQSKLMFKRMPKQPLWLRSGEICASVAFINAGAMHCFHRKGDKEITSHLQFDGMFCADFQSFMFQQPAAHAIETLEPCELVLIRHEHLTELRRSIRALDGCVGDMIQQFLISEMKRTASFLLKSPDERYLELLRDLPQAARRVPQYILASYLNMTPETFSRVRNRIRYKHAQPTPTPKPAPTTPPTTRETRGANAPERDREPQKPTIAKKEKRPQKSRTRPTRSALDCTGGSRRRFQGQHDL